MVDFDNDGIKDLLFGDRGGKLQYYKRDASGSLSYKGQIKANGQAISFGKQAASLCLVDWNNDGLVDMLASANHWKPKLPIRLYLNEGKRGEPVFTDYSTLKCSSGEILASYPQMEVADFTGDGKKDLVLLDCFYNSNTAVDTNALLFFENVGTDENPSFGSHDTMKYEGVTMSKKLGTLDAIDLNEDGGYDLAVCGTGRVINIYYGKPGMTQNLTHSCILKIAIIVVQFFIIEIKNR